MSAQRRAARPTVVLTCEHASNRIPRAYARLFVGARAELESHRGWDPGALPLAKRMARRLGLPLLAATWSRLLVESNRSPTNPRIWSSFTKGLPLAERRLVLERYWLPHREAVVKRIESAVDAGVAVHVAVHSFTPVLDGEVRNADVAFLFDSARAGEAQLARRWRDELGALAPTLRVRFNYPYRGNTDGLTTALRRRLPRGRYLGFELEVNQAELAKPGWQRVGDALAESLERALAR